MIDQRIQLEVVRLEALCYGADRRRPSHSGWTSPNEQPPDSPTPRLRLHSVARSGRCANGAAEVNTRGASASARTWVAPPADRSVLFRQECVMPTCTCAARTQVGGRIPCWLNYELIDAGQITLSQVAPASWRCSKPPNSRAAIRSRVNYPAQRSSRKAHPMTSGNSMRHQSHARGGSRER